MTLNLAETSVAKCRLLVPYGPNLCVIAVYIVIIPFVCLTHVLYVPHVHRSASQHTKDLAEIATGHAYVA